MLGEPVAADAIAAGPLLIETDAGGRPVGLNGHVEIRLEDSEGRIFKRRAVKGAGSPKARLVEWLVVELGEVKVYVDGARIVVTREARYP